MVVLDDEHVGRLVEHPAKPLGTALVERGPGRVLAARVDHHRGDPLGHCRHERGRDHAPAVHRDRSQCQTHGSQEVEQARESGVFDGDQVAGPKLRLQGTLDPVEGSAHDGHMGRGDPGFRELGLGQPKQLGIDRVAAVELARWLQALQEWLQAREQLGIGIAAREVPDSGGNGGAEPRPGDRRAPADRGAAS